MEYFEFDVERIVNEEMETLQEKIKNLDIMDIPLMMVSNKVLVEALASLENEYIDATGNESSETIKKVRNAFIDYDEDDFVNNINYFVKSKLKH